MPPPTARQKAGETDIFKLDGTDICTLGLHVSSGLIDLWNLTANAIRPSRKALRSRLSASQAASLRCVSVSRKRGQCL